MIVLPEGTEIHQYVSERNRARQYDFLRTAYEVSKASDEFRIDRQASPSLSRFASITGRVTVKSSIAWMQRPAEMALPSLTRW